MKLLENKIAFISGGSRGIGAAIVKKFAEQGADVGFSFYQNSIAAEETRLLASSYGRKCVKYRCDGRKEEQIEAVLKEFIVNFGKIDVLVNNAGIIRDNLLGAMPLEDWEEVISTNLTSAFMLTKLTLERMIPQRSGVILNISSLSGVYGVSGQANYAASKAGLIGLTKSVSKEVGPRNIRCNAIAPGIIETEMTENIRSNTGKSMQKLISLRRFGTPEEIAEVALFLSSDQSRYITGQVINVCGGMF